MKIVLKQNNQYILRFDLREEVIAGLKDFAKRQKVKSASI
jgi:predicted DNA-binding protein with PD1-like motif